MYRVRSGELLREPSAPESARLERWRISTFWVCLVGYGAYYLVRANLPAALPLMTRAFGYTNAQWGFVAACAEGAYALGKLVNGPLADRMGGKRIFLLGMAGAIAFNLAFAVSSSLIAFILTWCGARYFLSMGWAGLIKVIGHWYPPERHGTVVGLVSINFQFGNVVATLLAAWLVARGVGWRGVFAYPAAAAAAVALWAAFASKEHPRDAVAGAELRDAAREALADCRTGSTGEVLRSLLGLPVFRYLLLFSFLAHVLRSFFLFWTPKLLVDVGMGPSAAIFNSAIFPLFGCAGTVLFGWYTDRHAREGDRAKAMSSVLLALVATLVALAAAMRAPAPDLRGVIALIGLAGFFLMGPYSMSAGALTLDIAGAGAAGTSSGLIDGAGYLGGALASWAAGRIADAAGWPGVFVYLAAVSALATAAAFCVSLHLRRLSARRAAAPAAAASPA